MTSLIVITLLGMVTGYGLFLLIKAVSPTHPDLASALGHLDPDNLRRQTTPASDTTSTTDARRDGIGRWVEARIEGRATFLQPPRQDLEVLQQSTQSYWGEKAIVTALGFLTPLILQMANLALGTPIPIAIPALASLALAGIFWFLPDLQIKTKAKELRLEFVRAAVAYLQIVAIHRRAEAGATTALRESADISDSWMFQRIREELRRAQVTGIPAWDGLEKLGDRTGIPEMTEIGEIMRLAGDSGGAVYETLLARARTLNDRLLTEDQSKALAAATSMNGPVGALAGVLMLFILYPVVTTLMGT